MKEKIQILKRLYNKLTKEEKSIYRALYGKIGYITIGCINGSPHEDNIDFVIERVKHQLNK